MYSRRQFLQALGAGAAVCAAFPRAAGAQGKPMNVLLICVDDLRPQMKCYGREEMITPCLDRFAGSACAFTNHYVQVPLCGPSRHAMLASARPVEKMHYSNASQRMWRANGPDVHTPLPRHFREHGYRTVCIGKVSHHPGNQVQDGSIDMPDCWDLAYAPTGDWGTPWGAFFGYDGGRIRAYGNGVDDRTMPAFEAADVPDTGYADGLNAEEAIKQLTLLKDERFFLAVGFYKPHLPHNAPRRYWDLYEREGIGLAANPAPPKNTQPGLSLHDSPELTTHYAWSSGPGRVSAEEARRTRHAYFACVSYIDAQVGKVLHALDALELSDNTVVALWGDHGWHLGDLGVWGKMTTYDYGVQSPLIIRAPGVTAAGTQATGVVESVDLYPTLCALCGIPTPERLDGVSLLPMLRDPGHPGKTGAISYWRNGLTRSVRTTRYRLIEHRDAKDALLQVELYDEREDPLETTNIAGETPEVVAELRKILSKNAPQLRGPANEAGG